MKKNYDNAVIARANIIKRLSYLQPTREHSSETVFEELRSLVNEMVSSGYNVIDTDDPMWIEAILQKLPREIVQEFLRENKNEESYTVGQTLESSKIVIAHDNYIN